MVVIAHNAGVRFSRFSTEQMICYAHNTHFLYRLQTRKITYPWLQY